MNLYVQDPWETPWETDAHLVQYEIPGEVGCPRLNKSALPWLQAEDKEPVAIYVLIDVDNPGHAPWTDDLLEQAQETLARLPEIQQAGVYLTRHGYRLVWRLPKPIKVSFFEDWRHQFCEYLIEQGIDADPACSSWNHMFRAPSTPHFRPDPDQYDFSALREGETLDWTPPRTPAKGSAPSPGKAGTPVYGPDAPDPKSLPSPTKGEYRKHLEGSPFFEAARANLPLADKGERNSITIKAIGAVLGRADQPDPLVPFRLLAPSVQAQVAEGSRWGVEWLWSKCVWFAGLEAGRREQIEHEKEVSRKLLTKRQKNAAETLGHPDDETVSRHLIIAAPPSYYVLDDERLTYRDAVQGPLLLRELRRHCQSLCPSTENEKGGNLDDRELLARYSTSAREIVMRYGLEDNTYDPETGVLYERAGSVRADLKPRYHAEIARWLELLGGKFHDNLLDWLACLTNVDKPTAALYLQGENGVGKGLLGHGIARLWGAHCDFADITKNFNERLTRTPLVWADEKAEVESSRSASAAVRRLVGSSEFQIRRLYRAPATLQGCPRLLITANNDSALVFQEALSGDDVGALVRRFGHIYAGAEPREYLESLGGQEGTEEWVSGNLIAEHVLWLTENRTVTPGTRYLVEGWAPEFAEDLVTQQSLQGQVCIALVRYLLNPGREEGMPVRDGALHVNGSSLASAWKRLLGSDVRTPTQGDLASALGSMSESKERIRTPNGQVRAWKIKTKVLTRAAERLNLADEEDVQNALEAR